MEYGGYGKMDPEYLKYLKGQGSKDAAMAAGGLGLNVAGTALQGFGAYQAYLQAEEQRHEEQRRYEEQQRIQEDERKRQAEQQRIQNMNGFGGYAQGIRDNRNQAYQGFAARIGR